MVIYFMIVLMAVNLVGGQIVFQENDIDPSIKNRDNRHPVYAPSKCPENELFYPADQKNDWICDCRPAYIFHPSSGRCHAAYRQGPCPEQHYLVLPSGRVIPECRHNPCLRDGMVMWRSNCTRLDSTASCPVVAGRPLRVGVNAVTLEVECQAVVFSSRLGEGEGAEGCHAGCRRRVEGKCGNSTVATADTRL